MLKPTKILVPTDFSEYSDKAVKQALDIAAEYGSAVYIVHVVDEKLQAATTDDGSDVIRNIDEIKKFERGIAQHAKEKLNAQIKRFPVSSSISVTPMVIHGIPYEAVLQEQEKLGIDLVVIGSLGHSGIARFLIGGVARNVLKGAKCPVLLTKDVFFSRPTRIMVPTDFSDYSDKALKQGLDIARQYQAKVFVFHAVSAIRQYGLDYALPEEMIADAEKQSKETSRELMAKQLAKFPQASQVEVVTDTASGLTYEAILDEAKAKQIDLIVIASLGRSGIAKYFLGNVARNVLKGAKCPVLITR
jgi:universal stress protein A